MEDCKASPGTFTCPSDFTEVINTEGLSLEDIEDEDNELFLIQAPVDADLTKLNDGQLFLKGLTTFHDVNEDGQEEVYECVTTDEVDKQMAKGHLVLPERSSMKLQAANKQFKGLVYVTKKLPMHPFGFCKDLPKIVPVSENVKKRFQSLSLVDENVIKKEKCAPDDVLGGEVESSQSARRNHKHIVQDAEPLENSSVKSKKKKDKRDKGDKVAEHIKSEVLSDNERSLSLSEVTSSRSSKTKHKTHRRVDPEYADPLLLDADACQENDVIKNTKKKKHHKTDKC